MVGRARNLTMAALTVLAATVPATAATAATAATTAGHPTQREARAVQLSPLWPTCLSPADEFCVAALTLTAPSGTVTDVDDPADTAGLLDHPTVVVQMATFETGERLVSFNIVDPAHPGVPNGTSDGLPPGTYRFVLHLGDVDPQRLHTGGRVTRSSITRDGAGRWRLDISLRPMTLVLPPPDLGSCSAGEWPAACDLGNSAYRRMISGTISNRVGFDAPPSVRGLWLSANAPALQSAEVDLSGRRVQVGFAAPRLTPVDFSADCAALGLAAEAGRCVAPAYAEMNIPYGAVAAMMDAPVGVVRAALATDAVRVRVNRAPWDRARVRLRPDGVRVNLRLRSFQPVNLVVGFPRIDTVRAGRSTPLDRRLPLPATARLNDASVTLQTAPGSCRVSDGVLRTADDASGFCVIRYRYTVAGDTRPLTSTTALRVVP